MSLICNIASISKYPPENGDNTIIYFKGCGLKCKWCDRPETFSAEKNIAFKSEKCNLCEACAEICPEKCFNIVSGKLIFDRSLCKKCNKCVKVCNSGALFQYGQQKSVDQIFETITSNESCGVILTGGECLFQSDFVAELLKKCQQNGLHTVVETSFFVPFENIKAVLAYANQIFVDLKHHNTEKHREFTGQRNKLIVSNIRKVSKLHNNVIIRIPLVPSINDSEKDMLKFGKIINTFKDGVKGVELVKYDHLAVKKYESIGLEFIPYSNETQSEKTMESLKAALQSVVKIPVFSHQ